MTSQLGYHTRVTMVTTPVFANSAEKCNCSRLFCMNRLRRRLKSVNTMLSEPRFSTPAKFLANLTKIWHRLQHFSDYRWLFAGEYAEDDVMTLILNEQLYTRDRRAIITNLLSKWRRSRKRAENTSILFDVSHKNDVLRRTRSAWRHNTDRRHHR